MRISGIAMALLNIPPEHCEEFNRWYDLDHLPEHVAKPDVVMGRRYVATVGLTEGPAVEQAHEFGHPPYCTIYSFGGPLDFMGEEAKAGWATKDREIRRAGRFWVSGAAAHTSWWRLADAHSRASVQIAAAAIPHLPHRGLIIALGRAGRPDQVPDAIQWWHDVQLPDLFAIPGVLAALRFEPTEPDSDLLLHLLLCEELPVTVMHGVARLRARQAQLGRYPAFGGVYESLAFLPYQSIVPLVHDFDVATPEETAVNA